MINTDDLGASASFLLEFSDFDGKEMMWATGNDVETWNHRYKNNHAAKIKGGFLAMKETAEEQVWVTHPLLLWWRAGGFGVKRSPACVEAGVFGLESGLARNTAELGDHSLFFSGFTRFPSWCWAGRGPAWCGTIRRKELIRLLFSCRELQTPPLPSPQQGKSINGTFKSPRGCSSSKSLYSPSYKQ